ncbi:MAG: MFS transporter [Eubacterium sp.]
MYSNQKLLNRDFLLVVIGQIISLFGNTILRFALPLYLLNTTGSSAIFGSVMALSMIPMALLSPVGGIIADRINRRNIMIFLDFITSGLVILFGLIFVPEHAVILIGTMMVVLSIIQSLYSPSVQASVPVLSSTKNLMKSNAIINQVQALSSLLGPSIGGILYGFWGLMPIIVVGACSFFISAVMEIFIHIPSVKRKDSEHSSNIIRQDIKDSLDFICHKNSVIFKIVLVICSFNLFISALIAVGVPTIITINLALSSQLYGIAQGLMAAGALLGGILTAIFASKLTADKSHFILFLASASILPIGIALIFPIPVMLAYGVITLFSMILMTLASVFSIMMLSYLQMITPNELIGKVMSLIIALSVCSQPIGQALYGFLFSLSSSTPYVIIFGASCVTILITLVSKPLFQNLPSITTPSSMTDTSSNL